MVRIDLGCGKNKKEGHTGLDRIAFDGVDHVLDLGCEEWPLANDSVDAAYTSHFVEHLKPRERIHFCNELYRVLKPGAQCTVIVPHWSCARAYGDPTHEWPPISEFWFFYLKKEWRAENAPHTDAEHLMWGYKCDFESTWNYGMAPSMLTRHVEFQQFAMAYYKEAIWDLHATLTKRGG